MNWQRMPLPDVVAKHGDIAFRAETGARVYVVVSTAGYTITATWSDATREGPRLGSAELPIGASYPRLSPHVHPIGESYPTIHAAQQACEQHHRQSTQ